MSYILRYTRMVYSKKLPDRFVSCLVTSGTDQDTFGKRGSIVSIIEIKSPWYQTAQIGQKISNHLAREYFRGVSSSDINNFENAIKSVNDLVAEIGLNVNEKDWPQKTNAFLGLVIDNDVHFTQIGDIWSTILRKDKILKVSGPENSAEPNLNALFSSLTSGSLDDDDILVIANKKLLSPDHTYQSPIEHPAELVNQIITSQNKKGGYFSGVVLQVNEKQTLAEKSSGNYPDTIYLDQAMEMFGKKIQYLFENSLFPWVKNTSDKAVKNSKLTYGKFNEKVSPIIKEKSKTILVRSKISLLKLKENTIAKNTESFKDSSEGVPTGFKINFSSQKSNFLQDSMSKQSRKSSLNLNIVLIKLAFIWRKLKRFFSKSKNFLFDKKNKYISAILALGVLLIILGGIKYFAGGTKSQITNLDQQISLIDKKSDEARNASLYGDIELARSILTESLQKMDELKTEGESNENFQNLYSELLTQLDDIDKVTRLESLTTIEAPENSAQIVLSQGKIWLYQKDGTIYSAPAAGGNFQKQDLKVPEFLFASSNEKLDLIYAANEKNFSIFNPQNNKIENFDLNNYQIKKINDLKTYFNFAYLLDSVEGQVNKITIKDNKVSEVSQYLNSPLENPLKLAIDGDLYIITADGSLYLGQKGRTKKLTTTDFPTKINLADVSNLYTSSDREYLYGALGEKLIVLDKTGKFIKQYAFDKNALITNFFLNEKGSSIWVLTDKEVNQYTLR